MDSTQTPSDVLEELKKGMNEEGRLRKRIAEVAASNGELLAQIAPLFPPGTNQRFLVGETWDPTFALIRHDVRDGIMIDFEAIPKLSDLKWPEEPAPADESEPLDLSYDVAEANGHVHVAEAVSAIDSDAS